MRAVVREAVEGLVATSCSPDTTAATIQVAGSVMGNAIATRVAEKLAGRVMASGAVAGEVSPELCRQLAQEASHAHRELPSTDWCADDCDLYQNQEEAGLRLLAEFDGCDPEPIAVIRNRLPEIARQLTAAAEMAEQHAELQRERDEALARTDHLQRDRVAGCTGLDNEIVLMLRAERDHERKVAEGTARELDLARARIQELQDESDRRNEEMEHVDTELAAARSDVQWLCEQNAAIRQEASELESQLASAQAEVERLRKLFDDAGQGEHNVLALVDHYQDCNIEQRARIAELESQLAALSAELDQAHQAGAALAVKVREAEDRSTSSSRCRCQLEAGDSLCPAHPPSPEELKYAASIGAPYEIAEAEPTRETSASIAAWADETFGKPESNMSIWQRAAKEFDELRLKLLADDNHPAAAEECADVCIVLDRLVHRLGKDMTQERDRKMSVNRARRWNLTGDGHGQHVEEKENTP
ncbi:MAG TPA: hypothetical protein VFT22_07580 [Kofleriaceae bacterium]|nr:hypothetical protein [Kofleriaceae bacterium]